MADTITEDLADQQDSRIPARVPATEYLRHERAGGPRPLRPPGKRHALAVTTWPGTDPARTDPAPIHHALLDDETPPAQIAADLGISLGHLRQVLRRHPLPRPRRPGSRRRLRRHSRHWHPAPS